MSPTPISIITEYLGATEVSRDKYLHHGNDAQGSTKTIKEVRVFENGTLKAIINPDIYSPEDLRMGDPV